MVGRGRDGRRLESMFPPRSDPTTRQLLNAFFSGVPVRFPRMEGVQWRED